MWIILTIVLAINSMWLLKVNKELANRNEYLIRQEVNNNRAPNRLMVDKENKFIVIKFDKDRMNEEYLRKISDDAKGLKEDGYNILVMDNTFDFSEINIPEEEVEKLKKVLKDEEE